MERKNIPFTLDRASAQGLADQLFDGMREAIRTGYYAPGDILPPLSKIASRLGVSVIVPRIAYRRLAAEGFVVARPRIGSVVLPRKTPIWRGHVLCAVLDHDYNRQQAVMVEQLRETLTKNGYLFSQVGIMQASDGKFDFSAFEMAVSRPTDFIIVVSGSVAAVEKRISETAIPFATVGSGGRNLPGLVGRITTSRVRAVQEFSRLCRLRGIRSVEMVHCGARQRSLMEFSAAVSGEGIAVRNTFVRDSFGFRRCDDITAAGREFMLRVIAGPRRRMPRLFLVTDDYLANGMLCAILERGVRVPEDVGFVCCTTGGFSPVFPKALSRFEFDPFENGEIAARWVLEWLTERKPFPAAVLRTRFIEGETLS